MSPPRRGTPLSERSGAPPAGAVAGAARRGARRGEIPAAFLLRLKCRRSCPRLPSDATARCEDLDEGQLGDVLFEDGRTVGAIFGFRCARGGAGKPAALPATSKPGSGAALLVDSARCAMKRLFAAALEVLEVLARGIAAAGQDRHPSGSAAVATWPAEVRALAIPAHSLPIFGPRPAAVPGCHAVTTADLRPLYARLLGARRQDHLHGRRGRL